MGKRTRRQLREMDKIKRADESEWDFRRRLAGQPTVKASKTPTKKKEKRNK